MIRNARFWTWHNDGWVKLTLKPQQSLTHHIAGCSDEGWFSEVTTWTHDGERVIREYDSDASDCDGPLYRAYVDQCPLDRLVVVPHVKQSDDYETYPDGWMPDTEAPLTPEWEKVTASQRDVFAELAGY